MSPRPWTRAALRRPDGALRRADRGPRHRQDLPHGVRRAGAGARPPRHGGAGRRIRLPGRPVRMRQEHAAAPARRARPRRRRRLHAGGQAHRRTVGGGRRGVPAGDAAALAHGLAERHRAASRRRSPHGRPRARRARSPSHRRAAGLREQVSLRIVRRHAAARRHRAGAGARSEASADGRAVRRARRAHPREDERRAAAHLARAAARPSCSSPIRSTRRCSSATASS